MTRKILVVDDEPAADLLMRQVFRKEIRNNEYQLMFAKDGVVALKLIEDCPDVNVVLTDINMPGMDGITLLSHIHQRFPEIKVVMVSAYNDREKVEKARSYGAYEFINKPIRLQDMKTIIQNALEAGP